MDQENGLDATPSTSRFTCDSERWRAVQRRDREADGAFVYSVRTTGVYCRPSCPARLARRENVGFHATCADAEQAGFRACKRCLPNESGLLERKAEAIAQACRMIEETEGALCLDTLAQAVGMSRFHFHRLFKAATGVTPKSYAVARRARRMREALSNSETVAEAIYEAGFNASSRFYAKARHLLGMTPSEYRAGGQGNVIRFATGDCSLGHVLVAATERGVCAIDFGDDQGRLLKDFRDRFAQAELIGGNEEFERLIAAVIGRVENPARRLELPRDMLATIFEQRVWEALRDRCAGAQASHPGIPGRRGKPKAA